MMTFKPVWSRRERVSSRKTRRGFLCLDCNLDTGGPDLMEFYMLRDDVWLSVVGNSNGMLCIGCLEARLGRELDSSDFIDVLINKPSQMWPKSDRLMSRLTRVKEEA